MLLEYYDPTSTSWVAYNPVTTLTGAVTGSGSGTINTTLTNITTSQISNFNASVTTFRLDQFAAPTSTVSMNSLRLTNVGSPTSANDAVNRNYIDTLTLSGDVTGTLSSNSLNNLVLKTGNTQTFSYNSVVANFDLYNNISTSPGNYTVFNWKKYTTFTQGITTSFGHQGASFSLIDAVASFPVNTMCQKFSLDLYQDASGLPFNATQNIFTSFLSTNAGTALSAYVTNYSTPVTIGTSFSSIVSNLVVNGGIRNITNEDSCIRAVGSSNVTKIEVQCTAANGRLWEIRSDNTGVFGVFDRNLTQPRFRIDTAGFYYGAKLSGAYTMVNSSTATTISTGGSFVKIAVGGSGTTTGNGFAISGNRITHNGAFATSVLISFVLSATHNGGTNDILQFRFYKNGVAVTTSLFAGVVTSNTGLLPSIYTSQFSGMDLFSMNPTDYVELWVTHPTSGRSVTVSNLSLVPIAT